MADTYNGLYLEPDWIPALLLLAPSELGRLIRCAIFYSSSGKAMDLPGKERVLWPYIHSQIDQRCSAPHGKKKAPADSEKKSETGGLGEALPSAAAPGQKTNYQASAVAEENSKKEREETSPIPPKEEIERSMSPLQNSSLHSSSMESNINNLNNISQLTGGQAGSANASNCKQMQANDSNCIPEKKPNVFIEFAAGDAELLRALREFSEMRTRVKAPLTDAAKTRLLSKLKREFAPEEWIAVLDQSVDKCWKDIYPVKNEQPAVPKPQSKNAVCNGISRTPDNSTADQLKKIQAIFGLSEGSD